MVQRVLQGPLPGGGTGIRVSRPGFNVLDPNLTGKQLSFDSRWPTACRLHMEGTVTCPNAGNINTYTTIGFGMAFPSPPPCLVLYRGGTNGDGGWRNIDANWGGQWNSNGGMIEHVRIHADSIQFWHPVVGNPRTYKYMIMRPL